MYRISTDFNKESVRYALRLANVICYIYTHAPLNKKTIKRNANND